MSIKRTSSFYVDKDNKNHAQNYTEQTVEAEHPTSDSALSLVCSQRQRVPTFMTSTLRRSITANQNEGVLPNMFKKKQETNIKQSVLGSRFRSKYRQLRNIINCEICEAQMKKSDNQIQLCSCEHKFNFCESCLHHYVIYKVKMFEEVPCPRQGCNVLMDMNGSLFKQLPLDIQKNYKKLHQFYITANDPNKKLCPKQNCQGIIQTTLNGVMACHTCFSKFCSNCLLAKHKGKCDSNWAQFFKNNLHYRQCKKCKFIIQKNQGCNHMTCRCRYQFCYVCGADWQPAHYGTHDQNGNLVVPPPGRAAKPYINPERQACCDCACCNECCGQTIAGICKFPLKCFLSLLYLLFMLIIFICRDLLIIIGMLLITIVVGMFGFSCEFLSNLKGFYCILAIILFPICMAIGIVIAFKYIFCDVIPDLCSNYWKLLSNGCTSITRI